MNRRELILGVVATLGAATCPTVIETAINAQPEIVWKAWYEQWQRDVIDIMAKCWEDQILYGTSARKTCAVYPYIERVDPLTLAPLSERGGLFA